MSFKISFVKNNNYFFFRIKTKKFLRSINGKSDYTKKSVRFFISQNTDMDDNLEIRTNENSLPFILESNLHRVFLLEDDPEIEIINDNYIFLKNKRIVKFVYEIVQKPHLLTASLSWLNKTIILFSLFSKRTVELFIILPIFSPFWGSIKILLI